MAVNYNPKISINGLTHYFDSKNDRSYTNNVWYSLVSDASVNTTATLSNGFLLQGSNFSETTQINSLGNVTTIMVVISSNTTSKGSVFSIYDKQGYYYTPTDITVGPNTHIDNVEATSTVSMVSNLAVTNTTDSTLYGANAYVLSTVSMTSNLAVTNIILGSDTHIDNVVATSTVSLISNLAVTNTTDSTLYGSNAYALSMDYYADSPTSDISFYIDNDSLNGLYRSNGYCELETVSFSPSAMDSITIVYKNNAYQDSGIKMYLNSEQVSISPNSTLLGSFGNNLSLLSRNGQLSAANFPVRSVMIYNRELTDAEIRQNYNALIGIKE